MRIQLTGTGRRLSEDRSYGDGGGRWAVVEDMKGGAAQTQDAEENLGLIVIV